MEPLLTVRDARRILNVSESKIYQLIASGEIPHIRLGKRGPLRFSQWALQHWLETRRNPEPFRKNAKNKRGRK